MKPTHIILHHSLTKDGETVSWGAIRRYHTLTLGWHDIGYHFGIELVGSAYEILVGRLWDQDGAHCKQQGMNHTSIGICNVGNFDDYPPPFMRWALTLKLVQALQKTFNIPTANVRGHREYADYKSCPGRNWDMDKFRAELW